MAYNAALDSIYNQYLTNYSPKSVTKYDTHKKSELKSVYNSMLKLNKEAPLYKFPNKKESVQFAIGLKEGARLLRNNLANTGALDEGRLLEQKVAFSSNTDLVSVNYIGDLTDNHTSAFSGSLPDMEIEVQSLAQSQVNMGRFLSSSARVGVAPGTYSFDITLDELSYEFQFNINAGDTNKDLQERLSRLIDRSGIGLQAEVVDGASGTSALRIQSEKLGLTDGETENFHVSDDKTSKKAGIVDALGLDYVARPASNAHFTVNGEAKEAHSNSFSLDRTYEVTLHNVSSFEGDAATIGIKDDRQSLADNISHLFDDYNKFMGTVSSYSGTYTSVARLNQEMKSIVGDYEDALSDFGIEMDENGILSVNRAKLDNNVLNDDILARLGTIKNFSEQIFRKTNQISLNPMQYVDKTIVAYKKPGQNFVSPYVPSNYSGMILNYCC